MRNKILRMVATLLPWYDIEEADRRQLRTHRIVKKAERASENAKAVIQSYKYATVVFRDQKPQWPE